MTDPVMVRGMLRSAKGAENASASASLAQVIADCRAVALQCAVVAAGFEKLAGEATGEQQKRFEFLARGLRHTSEGVLGEIEDL
jgi:hypothetical protein